MPLVPQRSAAHVVLFRFLSARNIENAVTYVANGIPFRSIRINKWDTHSLASREKRDHCSNDSPHNGQSYDWEHAADIHRLLMQSALIADTLGGNHLSCLMDLFYLALRILDKTPTNGRLRYTCRIISRWRSKTDCIHGSGSERRFNVAYHWEKFLPMGSRQKVIGQVRRIIWLMNLSVWIQLVLKSVIAGNLAEVTKLIVKPLRVIGHC